MKIPETVTVHIHKGEDGSLWADVEELPGCFATGFGIRRRQHLNLRTKA
jgi:hypothetical protein